MEGDGRSRASMLTKILENFSPTLPSSFKSLRSPSGRSKAKRGEVKTLQEECCGDEFPGSKKGSSKNDLANSELRRSRKLKCRHSATNFQVTRVEI